MTGLWLHFVLVMLLFFTFSLTPFGYGQEIEPPVTKVNVDRPAVNINTSFYSHYIWRGYKLSHDNFVR